MFLIVKYTREEDLINQESHSATSPIEVNEVKDRMVTNKLQLNDEKTEAIICSRRRNPSIKYNNNINNNGDKQETSAAAVTQEGIRNNNKSRRDKD